MGGVRPRVEARTAGFIIRGWRETDGPALWEALEGSREHLRHMEWLKFQTSHTTAADYVRKSRGRFLLERDFALAIHSPDGATVLGGTGFHLRGDPIEPARTAEIGMWIRADRAGHGLGTSVLSEMIRWGFEAWGWMRLVWRCNVDNRASARCAEKAGMLREGTMRGEYCEVFARRDTACFGLTFVDHQRRNASSFDDPR